MALIKLSAQERRRISVFFTCLVLSGIAWVFTMLSNEYDFKVKQVLRYRNGPQKRAFYNLQSDTISATIRGTGWKMLFSRINFNAEPVTVDLHTLDSRNFVVLSSQISEINARRESDQQIVSFDPDTLYFDLASRVTRRVPVQLVSKLDYQHQFMQSDDISIKPDYVTVTGPASLVNKISAWKTDTLKADSIGESIMQDINLKPSSEGSINIYPKAVRVIVPVDEFTEKTLEVPVKIIDKGNYSVKVFPENVKVTFTTSLSKFAETDADLFEATIDMDLWSKNGYSSLPVKLTRMPAYTRVLKIEPQNVDFIVNK